MSTAVLPQAIPGAETQTERAVLTRWPSVASTVIGRGIGRFLESAPDWRLLGVRLTYAPALMLAPLAALTYVRLKLLGQRFALTNRRIKIQSALGEKLLGEVPLEGIKEIALAAREGQNFYNAADLVLLDDSDNELARLEGVVRPEVFRQNIFECRDALLLVREALATIESRSEDG
ncbi:MAG: hypothetical protein CMJ65_01005 [Planctomycetaceae bacterium]|nr:hypothetical protein [Planctomycetaceae bacterium]